jgi:hypothetical protein
MVKGLARAGHAEQHLRAVAAADALHELADRLRLVSGGLVRGLKFEIHKLCVLGGTAGR